MTIKHILNVARLELYVSDEAPVYATEATPFIEWLVAAIGSTRLSRSPQEVAWVVTIDNRSRVYNLVEVARGSQRATEVHLPTVLQAVLTAGCDRFIYFHSHPSGDTTPSQGDIDATQEIADAAAACGMVLVDSVVITSDPSKYTSLVHEGLFLPAEDPYGPTNVPASEHEALDDVPERPRGDAREEDDEEGPRQVRSPIFQGVPDA